MADPVVVTRPAAPMHLWVVGVLSLFWNAFGAFDYTMTQFQAPFYLDAFPAEQLALLDAMPMWSTAAWALGVWGAVAGSVALLLRSRWAVGAFGLSILGILGNSIYMYGVAGAPSAMALPNVIFALVIAVVAIALFFYARALRLRGILA